jgi:hypothetical protein
MVSSPHELRWALDSGGGTSVMVLLAMRTADQGLGEGTVYSRQQLRQENVDCGAPCPSKVLLLSAVQCWGVGRDVDGCVHCSHSRGSWHHAGSKPSTGASSRTHQS